MLSNLPPAAELSDPPVAADTSKLNIYGDAAETLEGHQQNPLIILHSQTGSTHWDSFKKVVF